MSVVGVLSQVHDAVLDVAGRGRLRRNAQREWSREVLWKDRDDVDAEHVVARTTGQSSRPSGGCAVIVRSLPSTATMISGRKGSRTLRSARRTSSISPCGSS